MKEQIGKVQRLTPCFPMETSDASGYEAIPGDTVKMVELSPEQMAALIFKLRGTKRMIPGVYNPETDSITLLNNN